MVRIEFTVEPFDDGRPGPHVAEAIRAAEAHGVVVDVGPFGSSCVIAAAHAGSLLESITNAAIAHGATHVSIHVETLAGSDGR